MTVLFPKSNIYIFSFLKCSLGDMIGQDSLSDAHCAPCKLHPYPSGCLRAPHLYTLYRPAPPLGLFPLPHSYFEVLQVLGDPDATDATFSMNLSQISSAKMYLFFLGAHGIDLHSLVSLFLCVILLCDLCPLNTYYVLT